MKSTTKNFRKIPAKELTFLKKRIKKEHRSSSIQFFARKVNHLRKPTPLTASTGVRPAFARLAATYFLVAIMAEELFFISWLYPSCLFYSILFYSILFLLSILFFLFSRQTCARPSERVKIRERGVISVDVISVDASWWNSKRRLRRSRRRRRYPTSCWLFWTERRSRRREERREIKEQKLKSTEYTGISTFFFPFEARKTTRRNAP